MTIKQYLFNLMQIKLLLVYFKFKMNNVYYLPDVQLQAKFK